MVDVAALEGVAFEEAATPIVLMLILVVGNDDEKELALLRWGVDELLGASARTVLSVTEECSRREDDVTHLQFSLRLRGLL